MDLRSPLRWSSRRHAVVAAAIALATVAVSHGAGVLPPEPAAAPAATARSEPASEPDALVRHYVALGDSFTSGPLIPRMRTDPLGCARSTGNYPSILARRIGVRTMTDVSCGGASTDQLGAPQRTAAGTNPPQLDALSARTNLVTMSIGGNDESVVPELVETCIRLASRNPYGSPCREHYTDPAGLDEFEPRIDRTVGKIHKVLSEITRRAPRARVVLVGYPQIVSTQDYCPRRVPMAYRDYSYVDRTMRELNRALQGSADRFGATFVDTYEPSRGHDACAARPWISGNTTNPDAALAFHPYGAAMTEVAELIRRAIGAPETAGGQLGQPPTASPAQVRRLTTLLRRTVSR